MVFDATAAGKVRYVGPGAAWQAVAAFRGVKMPQVHRKALFRLTLDRD
jgi:hypothetical protein